MKKNLFLSSTLAFTFYVSSLKAADLSRVHYPLRQGSTSQSEVYFHMLAPRLKDYVFRAYPMVTSYGKLVPDKKNPIEGKLIEAGIQDPEKLLHEKVLHVHFSGLNPASTYELEIGTVTRFGSDVVDTRQFKTMGAEKTQPLNFVAASCFCDEIRYEKERLAIWNQAVDQNPDFYILMGDQTYVDSFDYVERNKATTLDVWQRYFRSFSENPLFRSYVLSPVYATWDDHDTGVDNGNSETVTIVEARKAFNSLYGNKEISDVVEVGGANGVQTFVRLNGQNLILLDNRSYRLSHEVDSRYGHFGKEQEEWLLQKMDQHQGPFLLFNGDMWGSKTIIVERDGNTKRLTESVAGDHPTQYAALMSELARREQPVAFFSGDIHFSQAIEYGPQLPKNSHRYFPYETLELTSSPAHSIIFNARPGESLFWPDSERIVGAKDYSVMTVKSRLDANALIIEVRALNTQGQSLFEIGKRIVKNPDYTSRRRTLLKEPLANAEKMVKVAFVDADDTLRISISKNVSANNPKDVFILPGAADGIAKLIAEGFLPVIVSNQGGVYIGKVSLSDADQALQYTMELIQGENAKAIFGAYDFAEFGRSDVQTKPNIGMAMAMERMLGRSGYKIDWQNSIMLGDAGYTKEQMTPRGVRGSDFSDSDRKFAENLGVRYIHPRDYFKWTPEEEKAIHSRDLEKLKELKSVDKCVVGLSSDIGKH